MGQTKLIFPAELHSDFKTRLSNMLSRLSLPTQRKRRWRGEEEEEEEEELGKQALSPSARDCGQKLLEGPFDCSPQLHISFNPKFSHPESGPFVIPCEAAELLPRRTCPQHLVVHI